MAEYTRRIKFVPFLCRTSNTIMRNPVFITIDSYEVFQVEGNANFLMRLEFRQIDKNIRFQHRLTQEIFVDFVIMMAKRFLTIIITATILPIKLCHFGKFTVLSQVNASISSRVTW